MDPDVTLARIRDAIVSAHVAADGDSNDEEIEAWQSVGELFEALDGWLSSGGFPPKGWAPRPTIPLPAGACTYHQSMACSCWQATV